MNAFLDNEGLLGATWLPERNGTLFRITTGLEVEPLELNLFHGWYERSSPRVIGMSVEQSCEYHKVWAAFVSDVRPGQVYGYRAIGPWDPGQGKRYNGHKILLDPAADAICPGFQGHPSNHGSLPDAYLVRAHDLIQNTEDNTPYALLGVVVDHSFDWQGDEPLALRRSRSDCRLLINETHVRAETIFDQSVPEPLRGTYLGLACDAPVNRMLSLGITAVELMPVQQIIPNPGDYWKYNPIAFGAPACEYAALEGGGLAAPADVIRQFKSMVLALHRAGIEVILDVVYNHTGESDYGYTVSFRGLDIAYYQLGGNDHDGHYRWHLNHTGCGNTTNAYHPPMTRLIAETLRRWVLHYHIDGFRFDLAGDLIGGDKNHPLLHSISADEVLSSSHLIVEGWSASRGGEEHYCNPGKPWKVWDGEWRDVLKTFWRGDQGKVSPFATCISGNRDSVFPHETHGPHAGVKFVTCHDGFTLRDLVTYNWRANEDGSDHNLSYNHGVEGPTDDPLVCEKRWRKVRAMLATLACAPGPVMLRAGDVFGHTQRGNNNPYQDGDEVNGIGYYDVDLFNFSRGIFAPRRKYPNLRRWQFVPSWGESYGYGWYSENGEPMCSETWAFPNLHDLGVWLPGKINEVCEDETAEDLLLIFNAWGQPLSFELPAPSRTRFLRWNRIFESALPDPFAPYCWSEGAYQIEWSSVALFVAQE